MMILLVWLLGCGVVSDYLGGGVQKEHLERLCRIAGDVQQMPEGRQLTAIGERLAKEHVPQLEQAWDAIQSAPPELRRTLYRELLRQAGYEGFRCGPLERALLGGAPTGDNPRTGKGRRRRSR